LLIIFNKENSHVIGKFSDDQKFENIYKGSEYALNNLTSIHINDELIPKDDLNNYKIIDGQFIKLIKEELQPSKSRTEIEIDYLKKENADLWYVIMTGGSA